MAQALLIGIMAAAIVVLGFEVARLARRIRLIETYLLHRDAGKGPNDRVARDLSRAKRP